MTLAEAPEIHSIGSKIKSIRERSGLTREPLSETSKSRIWMERYKSPNGMVGAAAHFGERFPRRSVNKIIREKLHEEPTEKTGFSVVYRTPEGDSLDDMDKDMFEVAKKLVQDALERKGWKIEDVDVLDFTSSMGDLGLARKIATEIGIKEEDIESGKTTVTGKYIACDGSGKAIYDRLREEDASGRKGRKVLLLSIDPVTSLMPFDPTKVDTLTMQLFSNGAAVLAYQPGVDMRLLVGKTEARHDMAGIKAIPRYHEHIKDKEGGPLFKINNNGVVEEMTSYPHPENENGEMDGGETYEFFRGYEGKDAMEVHGLYKNDYPDQEPQHILGHIPGIQVVRGLGKYLRVLSRKANSFDFMSQFKWMVSDGNSSGSTSLISFVRSMFEFKPGEHVFYLSFGAGGSFTNFVVEIGDGSSTASSTPHELVA